MRQYRGPGPSILVPLALVVLAACGENPAKLQGERLADQGSRPADPPEQRTIPAGQSRIRTIRGVELEKLEGPVGDWARGQAAESEHERQVQGWLQPPDIDFGEQPIGKHLVGTFKLRNPTAKDQFLRNITSSCGCQKVIVWVGDKRYDIDKAGHDPIPIAAGATGRIEAHLDVPQRTGKVFTEVNVETTDKDVPSIRLGLVHVPVHEFLVETGGERRNTVDFGSISFSSTRSYEFTARSRDGKAFAIEGHGPLRPGLKLAYAPANAERSVWKITGTIGPRLEEQGFDGRIQLTTDRGKEIELHVYALVIPPIAIQPGTRLVFGIVPRRRGASRELRLSAVEPGSTFRVAKAEVFDVAAGLLPAGSRFEVQVDNAPDSRAATIRITVPKGLRKGLFNCGLRIRFEEDRYEPREVRFIGHVR